MILHEYRLIITPTRKVAGTSVLKALQPFLRRERDRERFSQGVLSGIKTGLERPAQGNWDAEVTNGPCRSYLKVLMIRNPFQKLLSGYHFLQQRNLWGFDEPTFRDFVLNRELYRPGHTNKNLRIWAHTWRTMSEMSFINGRFAYDDLIRFESLQFDFHRICLKCSLPLIKLPHANSITYPPAEEEYDQDLAEIVREHFSEDLKHFGYKSAYQELSS